MQKLLFVPVRINRTVCIKYVQAHGVESWSLVSVILSHWAKPLTLIKHSIHFISQAWVNFSCWQHSNISCVGNGWWSVSLQTKPLRPKPVCVRVCVRDPRVQQSFLKVTGRNVTPKCGAISSECVSSPLTSPAGSPNAELEVLISADKFYVTGHVFPPTCPPVVGHTTCNNSNNKITHGGSTSKA